MKLKEITKVTEMDELDGRFKLLLITAELCGQCAEMEPVVAKIANDHGFAARKMDGPSNMDFMKELHVMSVPVLVYFVDGKWVARDLGVKQRQLITSKAAYLLA